MRLRKKVLKKASDEPSGTRRGVVKWAYKGVIALLIQATLLISCSGRWN
jgi:hypothetical protein